MHNDMQVGKCYRRNQDDRSLISRATIAILACILIDAAGSGYVPGELSMPCLTAGCAALLGVFVLGSTDRRRRQQWDAVLHITTARGILDQLAVLREHRRTLREFGRLLCERPRGPSSKRVRELEASVLDRAHHSVDPANEIL